MFCYQMAQDKTLLLGPPGRYLVDVGTRGRAATRWCSTYPLRSARPGATTLPASSDVVLEAVARSGREQARARAKRGVGEEEEGGEKVKTSVER